MTNNFSTLKYNQSASRFYLIRLNPARLLNDYLTDNLDGTYSMTTDLIFNEIHENGELINKVAVGTLSVREWFYDETTKELQIYPASAPSTSHFIVGGYLLFYTTEKEKVYYQDPDDDTTTLRTWQARILNAPTIKQNIKNILAGTITIQSSSLSLIDYNQEFREYLTNDDTFNKRPIKTWMCLDELDNHQLVFDGTTSNINYDNEKVTIETNDGLSKLLEIASCGDDEGEIYHLLASNNALHPAKDKTPIRMVIGNISTYAVKSVGSGITDGAPSAVTSNSGKLLEAVCINYSLSLTTNNNRSWGLCRSIAGFYDFSMSNIPFKVIRGGGDGSYLFEIPIAYLNYFEAGDTFKIYFSNISTGVTRYARVLFNDRSLFSATSGYFRMTLLLDSIFPAVTIPNPINTTVYGNNAPCLCINSNGSEYYPLYERDYTSSLVTTSGGNKYLKITLVNNFEANVSMSNPLDPDNDQVFFRVRPINTNLNHSDVLKYLIEKAGLTIDTTSFSTAKSNLDINVNFTIPSINSDDYQDYIAYCENIIKSTFSYLYLDDFLKLGYRLFDLPTGGTFINDTDILKNSKNYAVDYKDLVTSYIVSNEHVYYDIDRTRTGPIWSYNTDYFNFFIARNDKAKYLHGVDSLESFEHVLETKDYVARFADIMAFKSERLKTTQFKTAMINLDSNIGDDINSEKIISIDKNLKDATIITTDLLGAG